MGCRARPGGSRRGTRLSERDGDDDRIRRRQLVNSALVFIACFGLWLVLSGHPTPLHVAQGLLAAALVTYLNRDLEAVSRSVRCCPRFVAYLPWLFKEIVLANVQVARIVLDPRLPIDPGLVRVPTRLRSALAVTTFANSITLTPGTVTVDVEGDELVVHALVRQPPEGFAAMERRVAAALREPGA
jgi:multicomponent Na+:H+ antiporter subunit E